MLYEYFIFKMQLYVCLCDGILLGQLLPLYSFRDNSSWFWSGICRRSGPVINACYAGFRFYFHPLLNIYMKPLGKIIHWHEMQHYCTPRYFTVEQMRLLKLYSSVWMLWGTGQGRTGFDWVDLGLGLVDSWTWVGASFSELLHNFGVLLNLQLLFKGQITAVAKQL